MIDLTQYRVSIGVFVCVIRSNRKTLCSNLFHWNVIYLNFLFRILVLPNLIRQCGDVESNPGPGPLASEPKIVHINLRSITADGDTTGGTTKFSEFESFVSSYEFDIIGITETWLDTDIDNDKLYLNNYLPPIRRDRTRHGGGVCVYINENFPAKRVPALEPINIESICIECQIKHRHILICFVYKAPNADTVDFLSDVDDILSNSSGYSDIIFMGDFNCKHSHFCPTDSTNTEGKLLKAYFDSKDFTQLVHEPTRFQGDSSSCLDLIFTNCATNTRDVNVHPPINNCDHCPISCRMALSHPNHSSYKRMVWDFKRANFDTLRSILSHTRWDSVFDKANINEITSEFMYLFEKVCEACVPHYETTIRPRDKPYITTEVKRLIRRRDRLYKIDKSELTPVSRLNYTQARNTVVSTIRHSIRTCEERQLNIISDSSITNTNIYWRALKAKYSVKPRPKIPPLAHNGLIITDPTQKAQLFNDYFIEQTNLNDEHCNLPNDYPCTPHSLDKFSITEFEIFKILSKLDPSKATGPDGIGNKLLKESAISICEPLCKIFQRSLDAGIFPDMWKLASVTALHKKGSVNECNNYRPISLLPCIAKVFEKVVFNHMYNYLNRNNLISPNQSGFRPGDSTVRQLVSICHKISQSLDIGDEVLSVFLDFRKAFDKVWHKGLMFKLRKLGIIGSLLKWLESYLTNRQQCVVIQGCKSTYQNIMAGVPQGSVLGPLLFLMYINDICTGLTSIVQLYADDTSLFRIVRNRNITSAIGHMNSDLLMIQRWSQQWLVEVSTEKSVSMLISKKCVPTQMLPVSYGNANLENVIHHKHLGLWFDTKLSWSYHIENICAVASKRLNMMLPLKYELNRDTLETIYKTFVRPVLEYGDVIFDNCTEQQKSELEFIQMQAARTVTGAKRHTSHTLLYEETGWTTLNERRRLHKLILMHQIVHKISPKYLTDLLPASRSARVTRQTTRLIPQFSHRTNAFKRSFIPSAIDLWNTVLDDNMRHTQSKAIFRRLIKKLIEHKPLNDLQKLWFYMGSRASQIITSQMRLEFSDLNDHLHKKQCVPSPLCPCGQNVETIQHYFFECNLYRNERITLYHTLGNISHTIQPSTKTFLYGLKDESTELNMNFLACIQIYISNTKRFKYKK